MEWHPYLSGAPSGVVSAVHVGAGSRVKQFADESVVDAHIASGVGRCDGVNVGDLMSTVSMVIS